MKRLLLRFTANLLAFAISFAAALLTHSFRQLRTHGQENVDLQSRIKRELPEAEPVVHDDDITVEGRYVNFDYAYSVLVPRGMMAVMNSNPPNPNHGFGIDLMHPTSTAWTMPKLSLWADASYDSAEYGSPNAMIKNNLEWLREKHTQVRLLSRSPARLGSLSAVRFVISYVDSGEAMIEDQIVAFRSQLGEEGDIVYTIDLRTTVSRHKQDKRLVLEMQRSWIVDPLPNVYPLPPVYEEGR
jgi:hypothetical protein